MIRYRRCSRALALALGMMVTVALPGRGWAQFVYVNNNIGGTNSISGFSVGTGGTLSLLSGSPFPTGGGGSFSQDVGSANVVVTKQRLYASNAISNNIAAFDINTDGSLTTIPGSPFPTLGTRPNGIAINSAGTLLFVADFSSNNVSVFTIASNGALTLVPNTPFAAGSGPLALQIDSANSLLFASQSGFGVGVYTIGAMGSSLTAIGGSPFLAGGGGTETGLAIDAAATRLYVADYTANTVSGFTIGGGGTLSGVTGSPFGAGTGPTGVLFHPSLNVLYVSNDTSSDIYTYSIGGGGALGTPSITGAGGNGTAGMVIDPAHQLLFAINGATNPMPGLNVSVFSVNGTTGALTAVGGSPFSTGVGSGRPSSIALASVCPSAPQGSCLTALKSSLQIKNTTPDEKDRLTWKWTKGVPTTQDEFGLPVLTRTYALCVYDANGMVLSAEVAADAICGSVPCWSTTRFTGIKYKDKLAASDGVTGITCKGSTVQKSSITFKGKGVTLPDPTLPLTAPVTAQFINTDSGVCFTGTYSGSGISKNDGTQFRGKAP